MSAEKNQQDFPGTVTYYFNHVKFISTYADPIFIISFMNIE